MTVNICHSERSISAVEESQTNIDVSTTLNMTVNICHSELVEESQTNKTKNKKIKQGGNKYVQKQEI